MRCRQLTKLLRSFSARQIDARTWIDSLAKQSAVRDHTVCVQVNVHKYGPEGGVDLIRAMSTIYNETRAFLIHNYDITEDVVCDLVRA